jgi:hypothetical protein
MKPRSGDQFFATSVPMIATRATMAQTPPEMKWSTAKSVISPGRFRGEAAGALRVEAPQAGQVA